MVSLAYTPLEQSYDFVYYPSYIICFARSPVFGLKTFGLPTYARKWRMAGGSYTGTHDSD